MELARLKEVELRKVWNHEQYDFSEWLSKNENIELLNEILGLTLTNISKEEHVGSYRCDIVANDELTGMKVIIENQLEVSDHDHLGKIITYASGLDANVIVWIVKQAKEEHKSAIEWLNNNTNSDINFFLLELHAYQINDSLPAPYFEVIEKPNDFIKYYRTISLKNDLNENDLDCLQFWTQFNELLIEKNKPFNIRKASYRPYYDISMGKSGIYTTINLNIKESLICLEIYICENKDLFDKLYNKKDLIEEELGYNLIWEKSNEKKSCEIKHYIRNINIKEQSNNKELMENIIKETINLRDTFKKYI